MSSRIELKNVRQVFPVRSDTNKSTREFVALDGLDLTVEPGEFLTLVGPSGCGKSTVLDLIAGLTVPTAGIVLTDGEEITGPGLDRGVVFQQYTLLPWRSALGNVEFALEAAGGLSRTQRRKTAREYLELVGLTEFADRFPHELSGGMKQRVAIARSLSYQPGVLLMDEPFGALDAQTREKLQEQLVEIWRATGTTFVFITHDLDEAIFLGERVAVMKGRPGRIDKLITIDLGHHNDHGIGDGDVRSTHEFARYRRMIWSLLHEESTRRNELVEVGSDA